MKCGSDVPSLYYVSSISMCNRNLVPLGMMDLLPLFRHPFRHRWHRGKSTAPELNLKTYTRVLEDLQNAQGLRTCIRRRLRNWSPQRSRQPGASDFIFTRGPSPERTNRNSSPLSHAAVDVLKKVCILPAHEVCLSDAGFARPDLNRVHARFST